MDVEKDGRLPIILEGVRLVKECLGDCVPVNATVTGLFTVAAMVLGTENLMIGMIKKPDKIKQLMEVIVENNNRYIKRFLDLEVGICFNLGLSAPNRNARKNMHALMNAARIYGRYPLNIV